MFHVRVEGGDGDGFWGGTEAGLEAEGEEAEGCVEAGWVVVSEAKRRGVGGEGRWRSGLWGFEGRKGVVVAWYWRVRAGWSLKL